VTDTSASEGNCVEEILICGITITETLAGVEKEWEMDVLKSTLLLEPDKIGGQVVETPSVVFRADEVVA